MKAMNFGFVHQHANQFDSSVIHKGLDLIIDPSSGHKSYMSLEQYDYNIINGNSSVSGSDFPRSKIEELLNLIIYKYHETPKMIDTKAKANEAADSEESTTTHINGKVIKAVVNTGDNQKAITYDEDPSQETIDIINTMITLRSMVKVELDEQILFCANQLRVGTLDMTKENNRLVVHTKEGYTDAPNRITRKQLIATLWFMTKQYANAPSFRKHLTISVTEGRYTAGYDKGVAFFKTEGLTQLEQDIASDLSLIANL